MPGPREGAPPARRREGGGRCRHEEIHGLRPRHAGAHSASSRPLRATLQVSLAAFTKQKYLISSEWGAGGLSRDGTRGAAGSARRQAPGAAGPPPPRPSAPPWRLTLTGQGRAGLTGQANTPGSGQLHGGWERAAGRGGQGEGERRAAFLSARGHPPTSAQLPPRRAGRLKSNQTRKSRVQRLPAGEAARTGPGGRRGAGGVQQPSLSPRG